MNLHLEDFEGPFDLLLHLVRVSKVDIYEVNIKEVIDQYLNFISSIPDDDLDSSSEYLVMASELVHLKSKMLVKKNEEVEEEESEFNITSEEDLRDKLISYEKYKNMSDTFRVLEENRMDYYTKVPENLKEYMDEEENVVNSEVSINDLLNAFLEMQKRVNYEKPITTKVMKKEYSVKQRIKEIRSLLKIKKRVEFTELFEEVTKENVVVTFLSLLDMSKNKEITLKQDKIFSTILIESVA